MKNIFFFIIILLLASSFSISSNKIICDEFSISHTFENGKLEMNLKTDLPDNTILMVSVSRSHWEKGDDAEYPIEYYSERSTVGKWKLKKTIFLNNKKWQEKLLKKQKEMEKMGLGFEVSKISNDIVIRFVVPVRQNNPLFGLNNKNLFGKCVKSKGKIKIVDDTVRFHYLINK